MAPLLSSPANRSSVWSTLEPVAENRRRNWKTVRAAGAGGGEAQETEKVNKSSTGRGWFYDRFVSQHTMEAKINKLKADVAARNGFVGTLFNDAYSYTSWIEVHRKLTERNLVSIQCDEAYKMMKSGEAVLVDVREAQDFEKVHGDGTYSAPFFRLIEGNDIKANARRLGYALITIFDGTERNPNFIQEVAKSVEGDKTRKIIVICSIGGTLLTYVERTGPKAKKYKDPERLFGRQSRSLKAAYELQEAGFENVFHLEGGLNEWIHRDFPTQGTKC